MFSRRYALEFARRQIELERCAFGNFADVREAVFAGGLKIGNDFRRDGVPPRRPDRQHARLARHLTPLLGDVIDENRGI